MFDKYWLATVVVLALNLAACGGSDDDDEDDGGADVEDASGAGIWNGTYRVDGQTENLSIHGLITEEGDYVLRSSSRLFAGSTATTNGNNFSANAISYDLTTGAKTPTSLQGTIADKSTITGSYSRTGESASFTMSYQSTYERPAALATIAGVYSASATSVAVNSDGSMVLSTTDGCTFNGQFTVPTPSRNYYRWSGTFTSCGARNGPAGGLAHLEDISPGTNNRLRMFGQNDAQTFPIVLSLAK